MNKQLPSIFDEMFTLNREICQRETRHSYDIRIPRYKLVITKFTLRYEGGVLWNKIPDNIKSLKTISDFKKKIKNHIISNNT